MTSLKQMTGCAIWRTTLLVAGATTALAQESPTPIDGVSGDGARVSQPERVPSASDVAEKPQAATSADETASEVKPGVRIKGVRAVGSGCPSAISLTEAHCTDDGHCRAGFEGYALRAPAEAAVDSKTCSVLLNVEADAGMQVAVSGFHVVAAVSLGKGTRASIEAAAGYLSSSITLTEPSRVRLEGPYPANGDPYLRVESKPNTTMWSPCGYRGPLEVRTNISLSNDDGSDGFISIGAVTASIVGRLDTRSSGLDVAITSRRCSPFE